MNRHLDGTELTRSDLMALALEAGMPALQATSNTKTWVFVEESRDLRWKMWCRGELLLDTRPRAAAPRRSLTVDWEVVELLTRA